MSVIDDVGEQAKRHNEPHAPASVLELDVDEFGLTVEDAEGLKAHAVALRASAAAGGEPMWRAQQVAQAIALESIAAQATKAPGVFKRGNGGEVALRIPLDAPWNKQEISRATRDAPDLLDAEASIARLTLARNAGSLSLAVDAAERSGAATPAEQMLAHQMATSHALAMKLAAKSEMFLERRFLIYQRYIGDADAEAKREQVASIEAARLATASTRMMEATARIAIVLDRLKNGTTQTIIVQQKVDVQSGAQAVVNGAVQVTPGRAKKGKRKS